MTWEPGGFDPLADAPAGRQARVELIGTHLRLTGTVSLGRFTRLSDMINSSQGYVRFRDARLLRRNGDPTTLVLPEIMVDQDEISFIAQTEEEVAASEAASDPSGGAIRQEGSDESGWGRALGTGPGGGDVWGRPGALGGGAGMERADREFVLFTPGHTVTGHLQIYGGTDLAGFVDSSDPRFVPVVDATARSLADRRVISHFKFLLINRTHMIAASELGKGPADIRGEDVPDL